MCLSCITFSKRCCWSYWLLQLLRPPGWLQCDCWCKPGLEPAHRVLIVQTSHLNTQAWRKVNAPLCHQISPHLDRSYIFSAVPVWSKRPAPVQTSPHQIHPSRSQSDRNKIGKNIHGCLCTVIAAVRLDVEGGGGWWHFINYCWNIKSNARHSGKH